METQQELKRKKPRQINNNQPNNLTNQPRRNILVAGSRNPTANYQVKQFPTHPHTKYDFFKSSKLYPPPRKDHPAKLLQDISLSEKNKALVLLPLRQPVVIPIVIMSRRHKGHNKHHKEYSIEPYFKLDPLVVKIHSWTPTAALWSWIFFKN